MTHFRLDVTITSITSITSGFWPDVTLDGSLPGAHPTKVVATSRYMYSSVGSEDRPSPSCDNRGPADAQSAEPMKLERRFAAGFLQTTELERRIAAGFPQTTLLERRLAAGVLETTHAA